MRVSKATVTGSIPDWVTSTYNVDEVTSLNSFTTSLGHTYDASIDYIGTMISQRRIAVLTSQTDVRFRTKTNTFVNVPIADAETEITELLQNYYNVRKNYV